MFGGRVTAVFVVGVIVIIVLVYLFITSWLQETQEEKRRRSIFAHQYLPVPFLDNLFNGVHSCEGKIARKFLIDKSGLKL